MLLTPDIQIHVSRNTVVSVELASCESRQFSICYDCEYIIVIIIMYFPFDDLVKYVPISHVHPCEQLSQSFNRFRWKNRRITWPPISVELKTMHLLFWYIDERIKWCWLLAALAEDMVPEQRRVQAGSAVSLPCYAATAQSSRQSHGWAARDDDVTDRKLRHSRRSRRQRSGRKVSVGGLYEWRRDDKLIDLSTSNKFSVDPRDHSLTIRNASSSVDTAMYSCVRRRRSHGNAADSSNIDDVIASPQIQLVVEGITVLNLRWNNTYRVPAASKDT